MVTVASPLLTGVKAALRHSLRAIGLRAQRVDEGVSVTRIPWWERLPPDSAVKVLVAGSPLLMPASSYLARVYSQHPTYSGELARLIGVVLSKYPDTGLVDVGASFGDTVAIAKGIADLPVVCVEGDERALKFLRQNIRQFANITLVEELVGDGSGRFRARFEDDGGNLRIVPVASSEKASEELSLRTLDECLESLPMRNRCHVLKIDTEGFDCRVLRGAMKFVRDVRPAIMMEYHPDNMRRIGEDGVQTLKGLSDAGYSDVIVYDNGGRLVTVANVRDSELIGDLREYAGGSSGIYYYDFCMFHGDDASLATALADQERRIRNTIAR